MIKCDSHRNLIFIFLLLMLTLSGVVNASAQVVKTGIDVLQENGFKPLIGKKIGLVTNPTGVNSSLISTIDILYNAPGVELLALFGPEHGVRGEAPAGVKVDGEAHDPKTGLPIYSLYGQSRQPSLKMLEGLDAIVYDIQDIGCRSYTYISTMGNVMKVAAQCGLEVIILDRPNPLGGNKIEGCGVDSSLISFVGCYDIPYIYGLTCGELAQLINSENMLTVKGSDGRDSLLQCHLTVVPMKGWKREMSFDDTGLPWVPTSPHIPTTASAYLYPATGILGELGVVSIGVGYTLPFQMIAAPGIDAELFASRMNAFGMRGVYFRPINVTPFYGSYSGVCISGVQIHITDLSSVCLSEIQFRAIELIAELYPWLAPFGWTNDNSPLSKEIIETHAVKVATPERCAMFDKVSGNSDIRINLSKRYHFSDIATIWSGKEESFRKLSKRYYLYK